MSIKIKRNFLEEDPRRENHKIGDILEFQSWEEAFSYFGLWKTEITQIQNYKEDLPKLLSNTQPGEVKYKIKERG